MDIKIDSNSSRGAFRTSLPGLAVRIEGYDKNFQVKDFSVKGVAFCSEEHTFDLETELNISLILGEKELLTDLNIKVVRDIGDGLMGCVFVDLDMYQEQRLDKLVLEVQKHMILLRKKKGRKV
ncbi:PilZ domain-containing protein [Maridesulfovibrio bastinii]|uniref:PilZ domain-containing protein n=1 Tax=Maridesulfovibrio bastinii TaxID=47157 RepID=UPI000408059D|nr:PilZ domain-containing protein [Maridesulfovibrio bastinii]